MADINPWLLCIDTGGTFTDCFGVDPSGARRTAKVLSSGHLRGRVVRVWDRGLVVALSVAAGGDFFAGFVASLRGGGDVRVVASTQTEDGVSLELEGAPGARAGDFISLSTGEPAPVLGARLITGTARGRAFPPLRVRFATTRGTNALLERRAGPAAMFLTEGFGDLLEIGTQQRPDLFALNARRPARLDCEVVEVRGRLDARGREVRSLDLEGVREAAATLVARGVRSAGVALMHAWRNPEHERAVAAVLRGAGFAHVSLSTELAGEIRYLARAQTTLANAALAPVIEGYLGEVSASMGLGSAEGSGLQVMTSAGGLMPAASFRPKDSLLSGPAGGVVGALGAARASGFERVLTFDMGGTSTDVARIDGELEYVYEHRVGPAHIMAPAVGVESVASGGGSVCWVDEVTGMLRVGPHSAGAQPGPACYGAGGPLTITDVNLLLGRVAEDLFQVPLDAAAAGHAAGALLALAAAGRPGLTLDVMLASLIAIANEQMAQAIRTISVQRGYDPSGYALVAFGGAGGQHACGVAELLGISTVMVPREVGLLSAKGLSLAGVERFATRQILAELDATDLGGVLEEAANEARAALVAEGAPPREVQTPRRIVSLRLRGQEAAIAVDVGPGVADVPTFVRAEFARLFTQLYGYPPAPRPLEVESVRVIAAWRVGAPIDQRTASGAGAGEAPGRGMAVYHRDALAEGAVIDGPAIIAEAHATTVVDTGWTCGVDRAGALVLRRVADSARAAPAVAGRELITARLTGIATDMGETLRRTALSTNVKDRLDFSCAVLDPDGELVVNAPHIPVHLGALGLCVRMVKAAVALGPGDVVVTNHPAFGGSHLPDVTVITPVFHEGRLVAFVASRAHHAEIGGSRPGSMPPGARTLADEGVVIPPMHLVLAGGPRLEDLRQLLLAGPFPTRSVEENLADVQAQLAANQRGFSGVLALCAEYGPALSAAMDELRTHSESRVRAALGRLPTLLHAREELDDGSVIAVGITRERGRTRIDFTGSSPTHAFNLNAPLGVIRSAVMYVLRLLVDEPLPLNEGLLRAVELVVPEGTMLNPRFGADPAACPAVSGGNVETSQRVVDTLLKALGLCACSQGTMNNVVFGNDRFGYYETVCGGAGAGPSWHGEPAVHTHMTNTRITDPEVLEHRYPVRLERFAVRRGSGGAGAFRGGDGVVRELTFLEPVALSLLTEHRRTGPYGLSGGAPGEAGVQTVVSPDGSRRVLSSAAAADLPAGFRLILETPGGGGYGPITGAHR